MDLVSIIGKTFQNHARQSRGWFRLNHSRRIRKRWSERVISRRHFRKTCLIDVRHILFDGPQGRRFHALVTFLDQQDYGVWIVPHLGFLQTGQKTFKWSALERAHPYDEELSPKTFDLCLSDHRREDGRANRTILLTHQSHRSLDENETALPFAFHPSLIDGGEIERLGEYRKMTRRWKVFFGGSCVKADYKSISFFKYLDTVNRHRLIEVSRSHFGDRILHPTDDGNYEKLLQTDFSGFVLADADIYRIPMKLWMRSLATADFFIAAPGSRYPMSHNCVESLAVGTIPILEYRELFQPVLEDGVNCLTYRGEKGFCGVLRRAEAMCRTEIESIRSGAIEYYEKHLSSQSLMAKLEMNPTQSLHVFPYLTRPSA